MTTLVLSWASLASERRRVRERGVDLDVQADAPGLCAECDEPLDFHTPDELRACAAQRSPAS